MKLVTVSVLASALGFGLSGCISSESFESTCDYGIALDCSVTEQLVYPINVPVSSDFNVNSITMTDTVTASSCDEVDVGDDQTVYVYNANRVSDALEFTYSSGSDEYQINGTNLKTKKVSGCVQGITVTQTASGYLDTTADDVIINVTTKYVTSHCCEAY